MFEPTISDSQLRDLLRQVVLTGDENDPLTEKMMTMEQSAVFATTPAVVIPLGQEAAFLAKLKGGMAVKSVAKFALNLKWLFGGLATVGVATTGLVVYHNNQQPEQKDPSHTALVTSAPATKDTSAFFIATPSDTFGLTPTPPARENVTEQLPEVFFTPQPAPADTNRRSVEAPLVVDRYASRLAARALRDLSSLRELVALAPLADIAIELPELNVGEWDKPEQFAMPDAIDFPLFADDSMLPPATFSGINRLEATIEWGDIVIRKSSDEFIHLSERPERLATEVKQGVLFIYIQPVVREETPDKRSRKAKKQDCLMNLMEGLPPVEISLPDGVEFELHTANGNITVNEVTALKATINADFGNVSVTNVNASLQATATSGNLFLENITGATVARSSFGDISLRNMNGATTVYSSSGTITASSVKGDLAVQSDFGNAFISTVFGRAIVNINSGDLTIDSIVGAQLKVNSNFGEVRLKDILSPSEVVVNSGNLEIDEVTGDLTVRSQFGEVKIDDVNGNLFVYGNSGNIDLSDLTGNLIVESVFGNVDFSHTRGNVSIQANSGNIDGEDVFVTEKLSVEVDFGDSNIELDNDGNDLRFDVEATMGSASVNKGNLKLKKDEGHIVSEKGPITIKGVARSGSISFD